MKRTTKKMMIAGAAGVVAVSAGSGAALAAGDSAAQSDQDDGSEVPITGEALDRASAAALAHTGEGRVTETEVGDEESYYEVEVTLDDGREVDVQLDESFEFVSEEIDGPNDD